MIYINDSENDGNDELQILLKSWGVEVLYLYFQKCRINIKNMESIEEQDYTILMNNNCEMFGELVTFRKFHREWIKTIKVRRSRNYLKQIRK